MRALIAKYLCTLALCALQHVSASEETVYPTVVLGGGVGGLTSSIYLGRAGIPHLVIEGKVPGGAITQSTGVQNWPGEVFISGFDLIQKMRKQAELGDAEFLSENIVDVDFLTYPYTITIGDSEEKRVIRTKSCIIALGSTPNLLSVPGEKEYWSKGVYTCAVCDGSLFKNKVVTVVGGGDSAIEEAQYLAHIAQKVVLIVRGDQLKGVDQQRKQEIMHTKNIEILYNTKVEEIRGNQETVSHVLVKNSSLDSPYLIETSAVFLAIGATPNSQLFQTSLERDSAGYILLKKDQQTSLPGVFAVGDITDPIYKQAITASGEGAKAALQVERYLNTFTAANLLPKTGVVDPTLPLQGKEQKQQRIPSPQTLSPASSQLGSTLCKEITSVEEFNRELQDTSTPIFIDFYAPWCGPCKQLNPKVASLANTLGDKVRVLKINIDRYPQLPARYSIQAVPTVVLIQNGQVAKKEVGIPAISRLMEQLIRDCAEKR